MGEVYRARDTKLNRDVAIKVLPELFAQTLAALNHRTLRRSREPRRLTGNPSPAPIVVVTNWTEGIAK